MTPRRGTETQRAYAERVLRETGRFATYDALWSLVYDDGRKCAITRLAAIVDSLRKDGWRITTETGRGELAVYVLDASPEQLAELREPEWRRGWHCTVCGSLPSTVPQGLGNYATATCDGCHASRTFRKLAAA